MERINNSEKEVRAPVTGLWRGSRIQIFTLKPKPTTASQRVPCGQQDVKAQGNPVRTQMERMS